MASADLLLKQSGLTRLLGRYGRVVFSGGYSLGLMMNGDIDIKVIKPGISRSRVIGILRELIKQSFFNGYVFYDWTTRKPPKGFPRGFYLGLKRNFSLFNGKKWKVDIWFVRRQDQREARLMRFMKQNLDRKNALTILKFKRLRESRRLEIPSITIYKAVLRAGISSERKFLQFARANSGQF